MDHGRPFSHKKEGLFYLPHQILVSFCRGDFYDGAVAVLNAREAGDLVGVEADKIFWHVKVKHKFISLSCSIGQNSVTKIDLIFLDQSKMFCYRLVRLLCF